MYIHSRNFLIFFVFVTSAYTSEIRYTPIVMDDIIVTVPIKVIPLRTGRLKKTGQIVSYYRGRPLGPDTDYDRYLEYRDDGYYQKGLDPNYSRAREMVTDYITGLQWQDDIYSKLVKRNLKDAKNYCTNLTLGGYTDWRLPTRKELIGLVDYSKRKPAINSAFVNTANSQYWSSTLDVPYDVDGGSWSYSADGLHIIYKFDDFTFILDDAWYVHFGDGGFQYTYSPKYFNSYARCVRVSR